MTKGRGLGRGEYNFLAEEIARRLDGVSNSKQISVLG